MNATEMLINAIDAAKTEGMNDSDILVLVKDHLKAQKKARQEELAGKAKEQGIAITDSVEVQMGEDRVIGVVSNVTDKGISVRIEGRERALFRGWHLVGELLEKGAGVPAKAVPVDQALVQEGVNATFVLKGKTYTGVVVKIGDKGASIKFYDSELAKNRQLARPFSSIIGVQMEADEQLDEAI